MKNSPLYFLCLLLCLILLQISSAFVVIRHSALGLIHHHRDQHQVQQQLLVQNLAPIPSKPISAAAAGPRLRTTGTVLSATSDTDKKDAEKTKNDNDPTKLFDKIKQAGVAGSISLFLWEGAFWAISIPLAIAAYTKVAGHWPDLSNKEDLASVGAEAFAFANVARFALPLRIGLAVSTTPWVQENIVDKYMMKKEEEGENQ